MKQKVRQQISIKTKCWMPIKRGWFHFLCKYTENRVQLRKQLSGHLVSRWIKLFKAHTDIHSCPRTKSAKSTPQTSNTWARTRPSRMFPALHFCSPWVICRLHPYHDLSSFFLCPYAHSVTSLWKLNVGLLFMDAALSGCDLLFRRLFLRRL